MSDRKAEPGRVLSPGVSPAVSTTAPSMVRTMIWRDQGLDLDGRPIVSHEDWQQGIAVVRYETTGDHRFFYNQVPFHNGVAMFGGKIYGEATNEG